MTQSHTNNNHNNMDPSTTAKEMKRSNGLRINYRPSVTSKESLALGVDDNNNTNTDDDDVKAPSDADANADASSADAANNNNNTSTSTSTTSRKNNKHHPTFYAAASAVIASRRTRHLFSQDIVLSRLSQLEDENNNDNEGSEDVIISSGSRRGSALSELSADGIMNDNASVTTTSSNKSSRSRNAIVRRSTFEDDFVNPSSSNFLAGDLITSSRGSPSGSPSRLLASSLKKKSCSNSSATNNNRVARVTMKLPTAFTVNVSPNDNGQAEDDDDDLISNIGESNHSIGLDKNNSLHSLSEHGDDDVDEDVPSPSPPSAAGARSSGAFALALEGLDLNVNGGNNGGTTNRRGNNRHHASSRFTVASANDRHNELSALTTSFQRGNESLDFAEELVDDSNRSIGSGSGIIGGKKEGLLVYPEVDMLLKELDRRVVTLENMVKKKKESSSGSGDNKPALDNGGSPSDGSRGISVMNELMPQDNNNNSHHHNNNSMTKEQQNAIEGLSSNIRGLIHCLNHRHQKQQDKILVALHDSDDEGDQGIGMSGSFSSSRINEEDDDSLARIKRIAKTKSRKELLNDILGPEKEKEEVGVGVGVVVPTKPMTTTGMGMTGKWDNLMGGISSGGGGGKKKKNKKLNALVRATVFSSNTGMRSLGNNTNSTTFAKVAALPPELLEGMISSEKNNTERTSAAYIAQEYGGLALPEKFTESIQKIAEEESDGGDKSGGDEKKGKEVGTKEMEPTVTGGEANAAGPKKSLAQTIRAIRMKGAVVGEAKVQANVGKHELEYLPSEFAQLGFEERKQLAKLLSWKSLKSWGFDAFDIEKLSNIVHVQRESSMGVKKGMVLGIRLDRLDESSSDSEIEEEDQFHRQDSFVNMDDVNRASMNKSSRRALIRADTNRSSLKIVDDVEGDLEASGRGCPILLIGWAVLASPYSQLAMAKNVGDQELIDVAYEAIKQRATTSRGGMAKEILNGNNKDGGAVKSEKPRADEDDDDDAWCGGYFLPDEFEVVPRSICRFLRKVEKEYSPRNVNPYHNNIHGADVIQTTHSLIQMAGVDMELAYSPLELYAILLAAACHDVRHPGTNNNYQVNKRTELSRIYNDLSVLENMHASRAAYLLDLIDKPSSKGDTKNGGLLGKMTKAERNAFRTGMIKSILSTDMSKHFEELAKMTKHVEELEDENYGSPPLRPFLVCIGGEKHAKLRDKFLPYLLHMADISNAAKPHDVSVEWSDAVYDEFFLQGDKEAAEGIPISYLCDRGTTVQPEAQVGFMQFVIKPAFELLGRCIPAVEETCGGEFKKNLIFWEGEKERVKKKKEEEQEKEVGQKK